MLLALFFVVASFLPLLPSFVSHRSEFRGIKSRRLSLIASRKEEMFGLGEAASQSQIGIAFKRSSSLINRYSNLL